MASAFKKNRSDSRGNEGECIAEDDCENEGIEQLRYSVKLLPQSD